ncbi:MAG: hypothetical protein ACKOW5_06040 [Actinomycetales bacterium]
MQDEVRGYVSAASGMTEAAADRAKDLAARLLAQGLQLSAKAPEVLEQIQQAADGLLSGQRLDPAALATAIREQVDLAIGRSSLVREEELAALRAQVVRLEGRLDNAVREMAEKLAAQASSSPAPTGTSWPSEPASPSTPAAGTAAGSGLANGWTPDV